MYLYRINNTIYPDKYFNFNLTVINLHLAPVMHSHLIDDISNLQSIIDNKSNINHQHEYVDSLFTVIPNDEAEVIQLTISTDVLNQSDTEGSIDILNNTIGINYLSPNRGIIDGAVNKDTNSDKQIIRFYSGNFDLNVNDDVCMLMLEEN